MKIFVIDPIPSHKASEDVTILGSTTPSRLKSGELRRLNMDGFVNLNGSLASAKK